MTIPAGQSCGTCSNYFQGTCNYDPPKASGLAAGWPPVLATQWCAGWAAIIVSVPPPGQSCSSCPSFVNSECHYALPEANGWPPVLPGAWCGRWGLFPQANTIPTNTVMGNVSGVDNVPVALTKPQLTSLVGQSRVLLNTLTANNTSPNLDDTTSLTATYPWYEIIFNNLLPDTDANTLILQVQANGSFQSGTNYYWSNILVDSTGVAANSGVTDTSIQISGAARIFSTALDGGISGTIRIFNPSNSVQWHHLETNSVTYGHAGNTNYTDGSGMFVVGGSAYAITGIRLTPSVGGNWVSGTVEVYGML